MSIRDKQSWYRQAIENLGLHSLIRLQLQKRFGSSNRLNALASKHLLNPVYARKASSDYMVFEQIFVERAITFQRPSLFLIVEQMPGTHRHIFYQIFRRLTWSLLSRTPITLES